MTHINCFCDDCEQKRESAKHEAMGRLVKHASKLPTDHLIALVEHVENYRGITPPAEQADQPEK